MLVLITPLVPVLLHWVLRNPSLQPVKVSCRVPVDDVLVCVALPPTAEQTIFSVLLPLSVVSIGTFGAVRFEFAR